MHVKITRGMIYGILLQIVRQERNVLQGGIPSTISRFRLSAYETGTNRLTVDLMADICSAIDVDVVTLVEVAEHVYWKIDKEHHLSFAEINTRPKQRWLESLVRQQFRSMVLRLIHTTERLE